MRSSRVTVAGLAALLAGCGMPLGRELFDPPRPLAPAEAIVVLGNRPPRGPDGRIAPESARRVERGVELFERGLAPRLVLAGGPAPGGGTEAEVMADHAASRGVPREAMVLERRSRDTAENARNSVALLCEGRGRCRPNVIVVTAPYHLRRAVRMFRCAGADAVGAATAIPDDVGYQASFTAYEYAVGVLGQLADPCARAAGDPPADSETP